MTEWLNWTDSISPQIQNIYNGKTSNLHVEKLKDITLINDQCKHHLESYWPSQFLPTRVLLPGVLANRVRLGLAQKQKQKKVFSLIPEWRGRSSSSGVCPLRKGPLRKSPQGPLHRRSLRRAGRSSRGRADWAPTALQPPSWLEALRGALLRTVHGAHVSRAAVLHQEH